MKSYKNIIAGLALTAVAGLVGTFSAQAGTYYSNYANSNNVFAAINNAGTSDVLGDQVILAPLGVDVHGKAYSHLALTNFTFDFWAQGFHDGDKIQVSSKIYNNDGDHVGGNPAGAQMPGSLIKDLGQWEQTIQIEGGGPVTPADRTFYRWSFKSPDVDGVLLPTSFTWTVQFSGLGALGSAGLPIYTPPTIGTNITDYWNNNGTGWTLQAPQSPLTDLSFAASFEGDAVPEPAPVFMMVCVVGVGGFVAWRARSRRLAAAS